MFSSHQFANLRPTIDTGASITKHLRMQQVIRKDQSGLEEEIFQRLKVVEFVSMVLQIARIHTNQQELVEAIENGENSEFFNVDELKGTSVERELLKNGIRTTDHSTLQSVIMGVGETDFEGEPQKEQAKEILAQRRPIDTSCPYLLLDTRPEHEFYQCHIISAVNYPSAMLLRATNYETKDMLAYKNQPGKMIIVYDDVEKVAPRVAATLVQRGYNNVHMLSGGLKWALHKFPDGLITGKPPPECLWNDLVPQNRHRSKSNTGVRRVGTALANVHLRGQTQSKALDDSNINERKLESLTKSEAANLNSSLKKQFEQTEIDVLQKRLEQLLIKKQSPVNRPTASSYQRNQAKQLPKSANQQNKKPWL